MVGQLVVDLHQLVVRRQSPPRRLGVSSGGSARRRCVNLPVELYLSNRSAHCRSSFVRCLDVLRQPLRGKAVTSLRQHRFRRDWRVGSHTCGGEARRHSAETDRVRGHPPARTDEGASMPGARSLLVPAALGFGASMLCTRGLQWLAGVHDMACGWVELSHGQRLARAHVSALIHCELRGGPKLEHPKCPFGGGRRRACRWISLWRHITHLG